MDDENAILGVGLFKMLVNSVAGNAKPPRNQTDIAASFSPSLFNHNAGFHAYRRIGAFGTWCGGGTTK